MTALADYLAARFEAGGFSTEDTLAALLPLFRQAVEAHGQGQVAPLDDLQDLSVEAARIWFEEAKLSPPRTNWERLQQFEQQRASSLEVVDEVRRTTDVSGDGEQVEDMRIAAPGQEITRPVYLPGYTSWEHAIGHHDPLTDVFSLGMLLASLASRLDFSQPVDLERFVRHRRNPFDLAPQLHPVVAQAIVRMTELDRHRRPADLQRVLRSLENYRDQPVDIDIDLAQVDGFATKDLKTKHQIVLSKLQERLFEISRRNRLLHFRATMQTVNLTQSSVPLSFDVRNIRPDQVLIWNDEFQRELTSGKPLALNRWLNFREMLYLPSNLDRIRADASRDEKEFGFAQLRLVACFLRWADLKQQPAERYDSPLVLLPVKLTKKKGVRDTFQLELISPEAEVNPVVRHQFKQLYDIDLPETIDLEKTGLDALYDLIESSVRASEPAVMLTKIERPPIDIIYENAQRRLDQYRRTARVTGRGAGTFLDLDYSYDPANYHPLGLKLFNARVRPPSHRLREIIEERPRRTSVPLVTQRTTSHPPREIIEERPRPRSHAVAQSPVAESPPPVVERERQMYRLRQDEETNPFAWTFDLCNLTLGNFKYRKMSLVRDYAALVSDEAENDGFDAVFSLSPRPIDAAPLESPPLEDRYYVVPCDPTQATAVARARAGESYIIQGPPGTGKSQTITNLIADYVIRGKRVLFVCEKRAAIDVVYLRLCQQGLEELCCLIHDSQTDKKQFVHDLKRTYETFLDEAAAKNGEHRCQRDELLALLVQEMQPLEQYSDAMRSVPPRAGICLQALLGRCLELRDRRPDLSPLERERLPHYVEWHTHLAGIERMVEALRMVQPDGVLARHPLRSLHPQIASAERPLEKVTTGLGEARLSLDRLEDALRRAGALADIAGTPQQSRGLADYAGRVASLAKSRQLALFDPHSELSKRLTAGTAQAESAAEALQEARERANHWQRKLDPTEVEIALGQAALLEGNFLSFFKPAYWRLRGIMRRSYDFQTHVIKPTWTQALTWLKEEYEAAARHGAAEDAVRDELGFEGGLADFARRIADVRSYAERLPEHVQPLHERLLAEEARAADIVDAILEAAKHLESLQTACRGFLIDYEDKTFVALRAELDRIDAALGDLPDMLACLRELAALPHSLAAAFRRLPFDRDQLEAAVADRTLDDVVRADPLLHRFETETRDRHAERLEQHVDRWHALNARVVRQHVRERFLENVRLTGLNAADVPPEKAELEKRYRRGRRDLEHEFGKKMRYKPIRDIVAGDSGLVVSDLKPVWLMSPLSVSDTLPLDTDHFDVVIFDEASQITLEEAIPSIFRAGQAIVVGDEMQLPPTNFFSAKRSDDEEALEFEDGDETVEYDLDVDSFLTHAARNLRSTMLGWHYRSRSESLISFSNWAFYGGRLLTVPDEQVAETRRPELRIASPQEGEANVAELLDRAVSFHFIENGVYERRRNRSEAEYIAHLVRGLLTGDAHLSIGIVAFSEAQQGEIERALARLAEDDDEFRERYEAELEREVDGQFVGLLIKNLENIQGDERDIVIMSVCYGHDPKGKLRMNFGPINQAGGEKRLNVAFSRAKHHMALISSIAWHEITNDYNDGPNCLKNYLRYAAASSIGSREVAERVLREMAIWRGAADHGAGDGTHITTNQLAAALRDRGYQVDQGVGQSNFRCDLAIRQEGEREYRLGILIDTPRYYEQADILERDMMKPRLLRVFGWRVAHVMSQDWWRDPQEVLERLEEGMG